MKRRAVCFLLCLCFCFCSVSLKSSAADEEIALSVPSELFEPSLFSDTGSYAVSTLANVVPAYDWLSSDDFQISDAMLKSDKFLFYEDLPYGMNTIIIGFHFGGSIRCFLFIKGDDLIEPSFRQTWGSLGKCSFLCTSFSPIYRIAYNVNSGELVALDGSLGLSKTNNGIIQMNDFEVYGYTLTLGNSDYYVTISSNSSLLQSFIEFDGETDDAIFGVASYPTRSNYNNMLQQEQHETSKSIWETLKSVLENIKNLPSKITEALKEWLNLIINWITNLWDTVRQLPNEIKQRFVELFLPRDGFFDTYQQEFQTYFRERFGILYEIPELVISLLQKFVTFNPKEDNYSITFPEVKLPVLEDGEWREEKLIEAQEFSFDFISEAPFSLLYDAYVAFIWLVYILLLVNLIKYKANSVFKGG